MYQKLMCLQQIWKYAYRLECIAKTRVPRVQKGAHNDVKM